MSKLFFNGRSEVTPPKVDNLVIWCFHSEQVGIP